MKIAFIFPGQGAQAVGMGKDFYNTYQCSKEVFDKATELLDLDMKALCFEENDNINITEYTQAALVTTSVAMLRVLEEKGVKPDVCAGLSLGEYCAMVASNVMSFEDAVKTVRQRGILMQEAVPLGIGAMCAVIGLDGQVIKEVCDTIDGVSVANYNCPGQIVISGKKEAVEEAAEKLKEAGAKRCMMLNVSGPFHSPMLREAGEKLYQVLEDVSLNDEFDIPYVTNVTAEYVTDTKNIKELLRDQVSSSVMWQQSMEKMLEQGVDTFVEIGPGKTLAGFMKRINKEVKMINIATVDDIDGAVELLLSK
ncbi:MAG: ACP S-malonyltransferase [Lachnospiraceae bacterium]|nr:ACP S-malonyltransferase [Lachnospiraceae bacterium]